MTHRRPTLAGRREIRRVLTVANAGDALGPITPGIELYALCKGDFSLIDVIEHCLDATGPVDAVISTWTAAGADLGFARGLLLDGRLRTCRWLVDFSFPSRQPAYFALLLDHFGPERVRATANHAKFVLLRNAGWNLVMRTSMNLNLNRRLESVELSDDPGMATYLAAVVDEAFAATPGVLARPSANRATIDRLGWQTDGAGALASHTSDDAWGVDVRRSGLAWD